MGVEAVLVFVAVPFHYFSNPRPNPSYSWSHVPPSKIRGGHFGCGELRGGANTATTTASSKQQKPWGLLATPAGEWQHQQNKTGLLL